MIVASFVRSLMFLLLTAVVANASAAGPVYLLDTVIELDEVQVRARHFFEKETAGMKQTQVDSLVITQKLHHSLSALLAENTSVYINSHGRGALATASFRGTAASHTLMNWNGIPINSPMMGMVDFSLIPVSIIDDLTLRYGSASVRDQSGGLGGSIHISNRADWESRRELALSQGIGSYGTHDQRLDASLGNSQVQWRSRIYHNRSDNDYPFLNRAVAHLDDGEITHLPDTNRHGDYTRYGTLQEFYWQAAPNELLSFHWWGQHAERGIPRAISFEGAENANISRQNNQDHHAVARWQRFGERGKLTVRSGFTANQLEYTLTNEVSGSGTLPAIQSESTQRSFLQHTSYQGKLSSRITVEGALDANHHTVDSHDAISGTGYEQNRTALSALLALQAKVHERFSLNAMLRQDHTDGRFSPLIPFLGADLLLRKDSPLVFKASIARNHRQPSLNDLYWQPGGNPELAPEKGFTVEGGLHGRFETQGAGLDAEITLFRSDINDWILWVPSFQGYWEPQNVKRVLSQGLEAHASLGGYAGRMQYRLSGTYAYTQALNYGDPLTWGDDSYGKQLVFIPKHSGNVLVNLQYKGFAVTWQHNSYSERFSTSSNNPGIRNWIYPYHMNDLGISKRWNSGSWHAEAVLKVHNVFDETYHTILLQPMPGRHYLFTIKAGIRR